MSLPREGHECLWCEQEIEPQLYCSLKCARAWEEAAKPWPIGYCAHCKGVFNAKGKPQQLFCSQKCAASAPPQPDNTPPDCAVCGQKSERRSYFCKQHTNGDLFLKEWLEGADGSTKSGALSSICRNWLLETHDACFGCKAKQWTNLWYSGPVPLEIDHIDGTPSNNRLANLRPLCPNCHATTDTYRGKNRGRGRQVQQKRDARLRGN